MGLEGRDAGGHVRHCLLTAEAAHQRQRPVTVFTDVTQFNTRRLAPKRIRCQHGKTGQGVLLGHAANVRVHTKNFLQQQQAGATPSGRTGEVGRHRAIGGGDVEPFSGHRGGVHVQIRRLFGECGFLLILFNR